MRDFGNNVAYGRIDHILQTPPKKCQAFQEERQTGPEDCIYNDASADSSQCIFCDGKPKKNFFKLF